MALTLEYQRGLRTLGNLSPERGAIPNAGGALERAAAQQQTAQNLADRNVGLSIRGMDASEALAREDMRMAKKDSGLALGVMAGNTGLTLAANRERTKMQEEAARRAEHEKLYHQALDEVYDAYKDRFMEEVLGGLE